MCNHIKTEPCVNLNIKSSITTTTTTMAAASLVYKCNINLNQHVKTEVYLFVCKTRERERDERQRMLGDIFIIYENVFIIMLVCNKIKIHFFLVRNVLKFGCGFATAAADCVQKR